MIMLADWHPDICEFIISKMQNPRILRYLLENTEDEMIKKLANEKLKFKPLTVQEEAMYQGILNYKAIPGMGGFNEAILKDAETKLRDGGTYSVHNSEFLTGANISVTLTDDFMKAVEEDADYDLLSLIHDKFKKQRLQKKNSRIWCDTQQAALCLTPRTNRQRSKCNNIDANKGDCKGYNNHLG